MLKKILIGLIVIVGGFAAFVATRPSTYKVERSVTTAAPPDVVYPLVSDFKRWGEWSPWEKLDPTMSKTFEGTPQTVGSTYAWKGNDKVGSGKMTLTEVKPPERMTAKLDFIEPWESTSKNGFLLAPAGEGTRITWQMEGENNFMGKAFSVFMDMDGMIGKDFEQGLASLKGLSEKEHAAMKAAAEKAAGEAQAAQDRAAAEAAAAAAAAPGSEGAAPATAAAPASAQAH